jgi:uncharacterized protein (DUF302 family)
MAFSSITEEGSVRRSRLIGLTVIMAAIGVRASLAAEGVVTIRSNQSFRATLEQVEASAKEKGLVVFARLDHAAAAASVGQAMPPSTVLVVGNPRVGTERFIGFPTLAIDLPLKILVWEDKGGAVSVSYNSSEHMLSLSRRHGLPVSEAVQQQAQRTQELMAALAQRATE